MNTNSAQTPNGFKMTVPTAQGSKKRDDIRLLEVGPNVGILYSIVDIGTHFNEHFKKSNHLIRLTFEFPLLKQLFYIDDTEEKPTVISAEYTFQIAEKSNLKKFIDGAIGRVLQEHEYKNGYNIGEFLGKTMICNIQNQVGKRDSTKTYNKISSVQGITDHVRNTYAFDWNAVQRTNELVGFIIDPAGLCFQSETFAKFPTFLRDMIMDSDEGKAYAANGGVFIEQIKWENVQAAAQAPAGTLPPLQRAPQGSSKKIVMAQDGSKLEWLNKEYTYDQFKAQGWDDASLIQDGHCKVYVEQLPLAPAPLPKAPLPQAPKPMAPKPPVGGFEEEDDIPF